MATLKQLEALQLWRLAEGKSATPNGPRPTRRQQEQAQFKFAESVAYGDLPTQLRPSLVRSLREVFDTTPTVAEQFTTLWELSAIDVAENWETYGFSQANHEDQKKMGKSYVAGGLPSIGRQEPYPQIGLTGTEKSGKVGKVGEAFGIEWEAIVNSRGRNVNLVRRGLAAMGRHAANEGEIAVARLLANSSGFLVGTGEPIDNATLITGNPDMTDPTDIATAIGQLLNVSVEGVLPAYDRFVILTSPAHAPNVKRAVGARTIVRNPGVTSGASWSEELDYGAGVTVIGWKWLAALFPTIGAGSLVIPVPSEDDLPVLTRNRLEGYPEPSLWIKDSNARNASGGEVDAETDGDFDSDAVMTKVRHVVGASALWVNAIGYSSGANS